MFFEKGNANEKKINFKDKQLEKNENILFKLKL